MVGDAINNNDVGERDLPLVLGELSGTAIEVDIEDGETSNSEVVFMLRRLSLRGFTFNCSSDRLFVETESTMEPAIGVAGVIFLLWINM